MVASFSFLSVCASNRIQIQPSALEPEDGNINIIPMDTAAVRQNLKVLINSFINIPTWLPRVWTMLKFYSEEKTEALGEQ